MRNFSALGFAAFMGETALHFVEAKRAGLDAGGKVIEDEAKRVLGTHDYNWPPLAPSTIAGKARGDEPGLETEQLRNSIERTTSDDECTIGTDMDRGFWFELGTVNQPPRPFLQGAMTHRGHEAMEACQNVFVRRLFGL